MKIKSILVAGILVGSLNMVGCQSTEESYVTYEYYPEPSIEQYEEVDEVEEVVPCRDCGNPVDNCVCVGWDCINCGQWHTEDESYYNEDGMSACSETCFNQYTGQTTTECTPQETHDMDLFCESCGDFTGHDLADYGYNMNTMEAYGWYRCSQCGEEQDMKGYNANHINN